VPGSSLLKLYLWLDKSNAAATCPPKLLQTGKNPEDLLKIKPLLGIKWELFFEGKSYPSSPSIRRGW